MVFGYPGTTTEYVPLYHIDMVKNFINPKMIDIRTKKIEIMESAMASDPEIRIQYSAKKSGIANYDKYRTILLQYKDLYNGLREYRLVNSYTSEVFFSSGAEDG